jgi:hypothetical protein
MMGFPADMSRTSRFMGTRGEVDADFESGTIRIGEIRSEKMTTISKGQSSLGHGGGDEGFARAFVDAVRHPYPQARLEANIQGLVSAGGAASSLLTREPYVWRIFVKKQK